MKPPFSPPPWFLRLTSNPWLLLFITMVIWGANAPVIRAAVGEISPMAIVNLRWILVVGAILFFLPKTFAQDWQKMRMQPILLLTMIIIMTTSNALVFSAAQYTSGINLSILQGAAPIIVLLGARIVFKSQIGLVRGAAVALSTYGIIHLATRGHPTAIGSLQFNRGDIFMLLAVLFYSAYVLILRYRPKITNYSLFCMVAIGSLFASMPLLAWELQQGATIWPSFKGFLALLYVAFLTSMLGQILFMRAIEMVGPGRASQFQNLAPVIGAVLSIIFLGEIFAFYHGLALACVIGGIFIAERYAPKQ